MFYNARVHIHHKHEATLRLFSSNDCLWSSSFVSYVEDQLVLAASVSLWSFSYGATSLHQNPEFFVKPMFPVTLQTMRLNGRSERSLVFCSKDDNDALELEDSFVHKSINFRFVLFNFCTSGSHMTKWEFDIFVGRLRERKHWNIALSIQLLIENVERMCILFPKSTGRIYHNIGCEALSDGK